MGNFVFIDNHLQKLQQKVEFRFQKMLLTLFLKYISLGFIIKM